MAFLWLFGSNAGAWHGVSFAVAGSSSTTTKERTWMSQIFRAVSAVVSAAAMLALTVGSASAVSPMTADSTEQESLAASRAFMDEYGIPEATQDALLAGVQVGQLPLSETPAAVPTSEELIETDRLVSTVLRYADGSISVTEVEKPTARPSGGIAPMAVTGCSVSGGSGYANYTNCKVHYRSIPFSYGFYANFTIVQGSNNDRINSVGGYFLEYSVGHSYQTHNLGIDRASESSSGDAVATLTITFEVLPGLGSVTRGVRIWVGNNTYWQGNS